MIVHDFCALTHLGTRQLQEDTVFVSLADAQRQSCLALIADGTGMVLPGQSASALVAQTIVSRITAHHPACTPPATFALVLQQSLRETSAALFVAQQTAAVAVAMLLGNQLHLASAGESRIYLLRKQDMVLLTRDHSVAALQVELGLLAPQAAPTHPRRQVFYGRLGTRATVEVSSWEVLPEDRLLLCSKGLFTALPDADLWSLLRLPVTAQQAAHLLVHEALDKRSSENLSAVVLDIQ